MPTRRHYLPVQAHASDWFGVASVRFLVDGIQVGVPTAAPDAAGSYTYSSLLDLRALAPGAHSLTSVATDTAGNAAASSAVAFMARNPATCGHAQCAGRLVVHEQDRERDRSNHRRNRSLSAHLLVDGAATRPAAPLHVCHLPPGTSKWNKIEHRLFSFISQNWRGKPLRSLETIINLIAATTTQSGLEVYARLDESDYPKQIKISDAELAAVNLHGADFHPEWNYTINPRTR